MDYIHQDAVERDKIPQEKQRKKFTYKLGIGLLICYPFIWLVPVIAPFTSLSVEMKAAVVAGAIAFAEVVFVVGVVFVGKEVVKKYRKRLNPRNWFKRRQEEKDGN